ncbi:hypothetical protein L6452_04610 [Arctium lappa]|uniref:Uncharacterized protein n=1 Tax=Arctium lappa TaxID=4217 RepID=A0ACB9EF59_ARCLA|nr:hypothetical protein L6452_04610 [Arctium lappa]
MTTTCNTLFENTLINHTQFTRKEGYRKNPRKNPICHFQILFVFLERERKERINRLSVFKIRITFCRENTNNFAIKRDK